MVLRKKLLRLGMQRHWPLPMIARTLGIKKQSLERWMKRHHKISVQSCRRGRPEVIASSVRWKIRSCYLSHYGQWGATVLRYWAIREGLGSFSPGTITGSSGI